MLKNTTAMEAEREPLRLGVENLTIIFPAEAKEFQFVENESREKENKVDIQSMRLLDPCTDQLKDVCVHCGISELKSKRRKTDAHVMSVKDRRIRERAMLPLSDTLDESQPRSPPESFSPTESACLPSPPGDPYFDTPEFDTPEINVSPVSVQSPNPTRIHRMEKTWSISSSNSSNSSNSPTSIATTIEYVDR